MIVTQESCNLTFMYNSVLESAVAWTV